MMARLKYLVHRRARPLRYHLLEPLLEHEALGAEQLQRLSLIHISEPTRLC